MGRMLLKSWCVANVLVFSPIFLVAAESQPSAFKAQGQIDFKSLDHDFGVVRRGEKLTHRFEFKNAGKGELTIQGVHASCGCTAVDAEKGKVYAASATGHIDVTLDTTNFTDKKVKTVTVMTNEPGIPLRTLTVAADVKSEVYAQPPLIDFGSIGGAEFPPQKITIETDDGVNIIADKLRYKHENLVVKIEQDGKKWMLTAQIKPGVKSGFYSDTIYVPTTSKSLKELPVPIRANIQGPLQYAPDYLEFGSLAPAEAVKRAIKISGMRAADITGTRAELIINGTKVEDTTGFVKILPPSDAALEKQYTIELNHAQKQSGNVHGKLFLQTSDARQKEVAVDFYAFFRKG